MVLYQLCERQKKRVPDIATQLKERPKRGFRKKIFQN